MKKKLMNLVASMKKVANSLTEDARAQWDEMVASVQALIDDETDHTITELNDRLAEIEGKYAQQNEEVADRFQKLRNELTAQMQGAKNVKDSFTPAVCKAVANAIMNSHGVRNTLESIEKVCVENGIEVRKKNTVTGLTYAEIIDYALQLKQENNDEIFDALYKTNRSKFFYGELDPTAPANIAKQWNKNSESQKAEQELALNGKAITTAYIYKLQSLANEDLDDAREAGQEAELLRDIREELMRAVKGLAVRAILVGDAVNPNGSQVTVFETIGAKTRTDLFTTVLAPAAANTVTLADVRKAAAKVKTERKWAVITSDTKLALAAFKYSENGSTHFLTDAELAEQLGVDRVIAKDYIGEVDGLHAIIFDPNEYWVKEKNVIDTPFPEYRDNRQGYVYEINMGGAIHGLESTAVLRESAGSSKGSK